MKAFLFLILLSVLFTGRAQTTDLPSYLKENSREIFEKEGNFHGPGVDFLLEEAASCQFVLFGERHFTREIPLFLNSLYPSLTEAGFNRLAVETGPTGAQYISGEISENRKISTDAYEVGFYVTTEEVSTLRSFLTHAEQGAVWGIDIEDLFGVRAALLEIRKRITDPDDVILIERLLKESREAFENFMTSGKYSQSPIFQKELRSKIFDFGKASKDPEIRRIAQDMETSSAVHLSRDGYFKNINRIRIMKQHFMRKFLGELKASGEAPKVILKLGSNHTQRGQNDQLIYDMGSFLENLATSLGSSSLHVALYQRKGRTVWWIPENAQEDNLNVPEKAHEYTYPPVLVDLPATPNWTLFDLRPLRELLWRQTWVREEDKIRWVKEIPEKFRNFVFSNDLVIMIPETNPQTRIGD